ncbi:MAG TPA: hypothetical protein VKT82_27900 [Ktedonobacterales bacterium]|nr:hypothetical protein [Ktedonobacterales bacterium]
MKRERALLIEMGQPPIAQLDWLPFLLQMTLEWMTLWIALEPLPRFVMRYGNGGTSCQRAIEGFSVTGGTGDQDTRTHRHDGAHTLMYQLGSDAAEGIIIRPHRTLARGQHD